MYQPYLEKLKDEIKRHKAVKKHTTLNGGVWKSSGYETLSGLIMDTLVELPNERQRILGSTISGKTLANVFKPEYKLSMTLDPRTINTLTKLSIFAGYNDWDHYVQSQEEIIVNTNADDGLNEAQIISLVSRYIYACYMYILESSEEHLGQLETFKGQGFEKEHPIFETIKPYIDQGFVISNAFNPSEVELINIEIDIQNEKVTINTQEKWLLCWWDINEKKYVKRWDRILTCIYHLNTYV